MTTNENETEQSKATSLMDLRGLVIESYFSDKQLDGMPHPDSPGEIINTAEFGVPIFISKYLMPVIDIVGAPRHIIAVADGGNKFRKQILSDYKSNRVDSMHPAVKEQVNECYQLCCGVLKSLGVPIVYLEDEEADDVLAYFCKALRGYKIIHTVDRDLIALSSDEVSVFRKGQVETEFSDKGVTIPVELMYLYKSIVGDSSDGYKGIAGVGPKGYESMLEEFGEDGMLQLSGLLDSKDRSAINSVAPNTSNKPFLKCHADVINWFAQYKVAKLHPELCTPSNLTWVQRTPDSDRLLAALSASKCMDLMEDLEQYCYTQTLVTSDNLEDVEKKS